MSPQSNKKSASPKPKSWLKSVVQKVLDIKIRANLKAIPQVIIRRRKVPATTFERFPELPDELQVIIIRMALMEPRAVIVEHQCRLDVHLARDGLFAAPLPLLQVCRKFRYEGEKTHPLSFAVSEVSERSKPWVRFNFDCDYLFMPSQILDQPRNIFFHDLNRVKHLVLGWEDIDDLVSLKIVQRITQQFRVLETLRVIEQQKLDRWRSAHVCFECTSESYDEFIAPQVLEDRMGPHVRSEYFPFGSSLEVGSASIHRWWDTTEDGRRCFWEPPLKTPLSKAEGWKRWTGRVRLHEEQRKWRRNQKGIARRSAR